MLIIFGGLAGVGKTTLASEVSLPKHELDLIDASVSGEFCQVTFGSRDSVADPGFVADTMISGKVLRDLTVNS